MPLTPRLLERPHRYTDESRSNYLLRLAKRNYLSGLPELASAVGLTPSKMVSMTDEALAQFLRGIDLGSVAPPVYRSPASLELVSRRLWGRCRVCPLCLQEGKVTPIYFDFSLSLRCETHQIFLLDHCTSCYKSLTYLRKRSLHCNCGQALEKLPAVKVDSSMDLFESLITPWRESDTWFINEEIVLKQEVTTAIALRSIINFVSTQPQPKTKSQPWIYIEDWPVIKKLISPWPAELAKNIIEAKTFGDSKQLSRLLTTLENSGHPIFIKLKHKLDKYRKESRLSIDTARVPLVSLGKIRKFAKLDAKAAINLFNSSYFSVKKIQNGPRGQTFWVSKAECEKLIQWFDETVSLNHAADIIGCTAMCARGLLRIGKLQAVWLPEKPRSPRFFRSKIDAFIKSIETHLTDNFDTENTVIPLSKVAPAKEDYKRWCENWPILIESILSGVVPIFRINGKRGWDGIGVHANDVKKCICILE